MDAQCLQCILCLLGRLNVSHERDIISWTNLAQEIVQIASKIMASVLLPINLHLRSGCSHISLNSRLFCCLLISYVYPAIGNDGLWLRKAMFLLILSQETLGV